MAGGMKVTLSALANGLTKTPAGRKLLTEPFVFQVPPLEDFKITHAFNAGLYDTIANGQFSRWGSRQLDLWTFDTLVMYLSGSALPSWAMYGVANPVNAGKYSPMWYRQQLWDLLNAGCPMGFNAFMPGDEGSARLASATLTTFSEEWKAGEVDCIYLTGVTFQEWRDPTVTETGASAPKPSPTPKPKPSPTSVGLPSSGKLNSAGVFVSAQGKTIPPQPAPTGGAGLAPGGGPKPTTLADLAKAYYQDPTLWVAIADANGWKDVGPSTKLSAVVKAGKTIVIPIRPTGGAGL
jgi:hypothetical protein